MLQIKRSELKQLSQNKLGDDSLESQNKILVMISTSLAARTSYTVVDNEPERVLNPTTNKFIENPNHNKINYEKMVELHDRLISQDPPHSSPLEHCARAMNYDEYETFVKGQSEWHSTSSLEKLNDEGKGWCNNFKGFIPYRYMVDNQIK